MQMSCCPQSCPLLRLDTSSSDAVIVQNTWRHLSWEQLWHFLSISSVVAIFFHFFNIFYALIYPRHQAGAGWKIRYSRHLLSLQGSFCLVKEIRSGQPLQMRLRDKTSQRSYLIFEKAQSPLVSTSQQGGWQWHVITHCLKPVGSGDFHVGAQCVSSTSLPPSD